MEDIINKFNFKFGNKDEFVKIFNKFKNGDIDDDNDLYDHDIYHYIIDNQILSIDFNCKLKDLLNYFGKNHKYYHLFKSLCIFIEDDKYHVYNYHLYLKKCYFDKKLSKEEKPILHLSLDDIKYYYILHSLEPYNHFKGVENEYFIDCIWNLIEKYIQERYDYELISKKLKNKIKDLELKLDNLSNIRYLENEFNKI